jgi:hypothetical protein
MKIIAHYLPQFHSIPENDLWWGKGYTEWTALLRARPLFKGHYQPRIPLERKYYNLLDISVMEWQAELAKAYGIYGFCIWHYWFGDKLLLEKPAENMLKRGLPNFPFCFSWANEPWSRAWYGEKNTILMNQPYGEIEDWKRHFDYLSPFFKDDRYIKVSGKPLFLILNTSHINKCNEMLDYWRELSAKKGLAGMYFAKILSRYPIDNRRLHIDSQVYFEPGYTITHEMPYLWRNKRRAIALLRRLINKSIIPFNYVENIIDYNKVYKNILNRKTLDDLFTMPGAFTDWDNTPRRQYSSTVYDRSSPENFEEYLGALINKSKSVYKSDILFINAWNEWAEGAYLEPDEKYGFGYLEAVKNALERTCSLLKGAPK